MEQPLLHMISKVFWNFLPKLFSPNHLACFNIAKLKECEAEITEEAIIIAMINYQLLCNTNILFPQRNQNNEEKKTVKSTRKWILKTIKNQILLASWKGNKILEKVKLIISLWKAYNLNIMIKTLSDKPNNEYSVIRKKDISIFNIEMKPYQRNGDEHIVKMKKRKAHWSKLGLIQYI